jgi:type IV secretion system protein VirD4
MYYRMIRLVLKITILLLAYLAALVIYQVPYAWLVAVVIVIYLLSRKTYRYTSMGTARWAEAADIPHMFEGNGLIVGNIEGKPNKIEAVKALFDSRFPARQACQKFLMACQRTQPKYVVRLTDAVHTAVFAPTGVGKGVSCIIPFLKTCPDSCVVVDFKAENCKITAKHRYKKFGHQVVILDPFKQVTQEPDTYNPLQHIDKNSPTALDECRDLAEALVVRTGEEREPHWNDSAELWISAMIAFVVCFAGEEDKNLQWVRAILADPEKLQMAVKAMRESDEWGGMLSRLGHQLGHYVDKELGSVLTSANRHLRFLDTLSVAESTKKSSFDPDDLLTGKMTVYLVLPPNHMRAQSPLLRLWINSMLRAVVTAGLQEWNKVHFICDEAASLGHMNALDDAVDKYRGYGIRLQLYYQSLGQLKKCWPEGADQTLLGNVTQVYFGCNDNETAKYISDRLGEETILVDDWGASESRSYQSSQNGQNNGSFSRSQSRNTKQVGRRLLKPEEVTALDERIAITFAPGNPPIWTWLLRYYEKDFQLPTDLSRLKVAFDTASLFIPAAMLAAFLTAAMFYHVF